MSRLATIDMDFSTEAAPAAWTDEWVRHRLIEAYRIEQRLPGHMRRRMVAPWPAHPYEFADIVGWDNASERVLESWANARGGVYAVEISRMEQAHEWLRVQLAQRQIERACLASWAACIAYKHSLRALMVRKRWSRSTFYRRVEDGSRIIAQSLCDGGVEVS